MVLAPWTSGCDEFDKKESIFIIRKKIPVDESGKSKILKMILNVCYALYYTRRYHINKLHCGQIISVGPAGLLGKKLLGVKYSVSVYGSETARFGKHRLTAWLMRKVIQEAEELIPMILLLCSDEASMMGGCLVPIDAGEGKAYIC